MYANQTVEEEEEKKVLHTIIVTLTDQGENTSVTHPVCFLLTRLLNRTQKQK